MCFTGSVGKLFDAILRSAGIDRAKSLVTYVFNHRPMQDEVKNLLVKQKEGVEGWPKVRPGLYLPPVLLPDLERLYGELEAFQPDLIICFGSIALWSVTGCTGLANRHGFLHWWKSIPVIPTYSPSIIQRKYMNFIPAVNDARRAVAFAKREIEEEQFTYIENATLDEIRYFRDSIKPDRWLSFDIETRPKYRSISCIGFGTSDFSMCVNFWDPKMVGQSFWPDADSEFEAMGLVDDILNLPNVKITQNGLYDIAWLKVIWGIEVKGPVIDTRLAHFAMFPELPHNLAEIVSTWLMMIPWKAVHGATKDGDTAEGVE